MSRHSRIFVSFTISRVFVVRCFALIAAIAWFSLPKYVDLGEFAHGADKGRVIDSEGIMAEKKRFAYEQEIQKIDSIKEDTRALQAAAVRIHKNWSSEEDVTIRARLMLKVAEAMNHKTREGPSVTAQEWLLYVLEDADKMPIEVEFKVAGALHCDWEYDQLRKAGELINEDWRRERAKAWLHAWKRLLARIDPDWDEADVPKSNVAPPGRSGLPAGVSPEAIEDPELRAEYERALNENRRKSTEYIIQHVSRKLQSRYGARVEKNICQLYYLKPYNVTELEAYLQNYLTDNEVRTRIIGTVKREIVPK